MSSSRSLVVPQNTQAPSLVSAPNVPCQALLPRCLHSQLPELWHPSGKQASLDPFHRGRDGACGNRTSSRSTDKLKLPASLYCLGSVQHAPMAFLKDTTKQPPQRSHSASAVSQPGTADADPTLTQVPVWDFQGLSRELVSFSTTKMLPAPRTKVTDRGQLPSGN